MDPAFLVWIPPIDEVGLNETELNGHLEPHYEEILPRHTDIDPGSNKETPEDETPCLPRKPPRKSLTNSDQQNEEIKSLLTKSPKLATRIGPRKASIESIQLAEIHRVNSELETGKEKETAIVITDNRIADYYGLSDIQFADEDLDDEVRFIDEHKAINTTSFSTAARGPVNRVNEDRKYKI